MQPFTRLTAHAVPMADENIDTDIIVPARFLLITDKQGLGRTAFYERRYDASGAPRPEFVLNQSRFDGAQILVAGANFGCGSSREHAPWALADLGFRAIIAPSFGEIFAGNCVKNGILPGVVADIAPLLAAADAGQALTIDLSTRTVLIGNVAWPFAIDDSAHEMLLNGWDEIDTILTRHGPEIAAFEQRQRSTQPWLWSNG